MKGVQGYAEFKIHCTLQRDTLKAKAMDKCVVTGISHLRHPKNISSITTERVDRGLPSLLVASFYFLMARNRTNFDSQVQANCGASLSI
ncbi:hypothetical protein CEXT_179781 [Caerostris extrusa]|uniref:Uncharacterized protein n=1 Tax=Caerostris extrusa TaxID=172846 RepID=A0AAV4S7Z9_CAEEX|nr:hypothetical protein CEXT_179781 [Caerostris extrusa]